MARTLSDGHRSPLDLEITEGNLLDDIADLRRSVTAVRRNVDTSIPANAVEFEDIWAANKYDDSRGAFVTMRGIDAIQLVSGNPESVYVGQQAIVGPGTVYFSVSAPDDEEEPIGGYGGWRARHLQDLTFYVRAHAASLGGTIALTCQTDGADQVAYNSGGDTWVALGGLGSGVDGQAFKGSTTASAFLIGAKVYVKKTAGTTGEMSVSLHEDDGNGLPGVLLGSSTSADIATDVGTAGADVLFSFANGHRLEANQTYHLVPYANPTGGTVSWYQDATAAGYSDGYATKKTGSVWAVETGKDFYLTLRTTTSTDTGIALGAGYGGWTEYSADVSGYFDHGYILDDRLADFYLAIPTGCGLNAILVRDNTTKAEAHWRAGHVRTPHIHPAVVIPEVETGPIWTYLTTPKTNASWDGDNKNISDSGTIDLSALFTGVPAGITAVLLRLVVYDTARNNEYVAIGPSVTYPAYLVGFAHDALYNSVQGVVPCDANGDVYVKISADSFDGVWIEVLGYAT